jgi:3-hydroxyisobutyrate dehydrogenase-like beta-hydroxyacid dehydrogenase
MSVLLLNPGQMGEQVGVAVRSTGRVVFWVDDGRGDATRARAERAGLTATRSLAAALARTDAVLSVVPPHAAISTAEEVASHGFSGMYIDCNAVSPATGASVGAAVNTAGARYVDAGIIGPPPKARGDARLYLAGDGASDAAGLFADSIMDARVLNETPGSTAASALKMAYAGWTKASSALLMNVRAVARANGVEDALLQEWDISQAGVSTRSAKAATANAFKAWRFVGEMDEIAATFEASGLPSGFHAGAADFYRMLEAFKDQMDASPDTIYEAIETHAAGKRPSSC